MMMNDVPQSTYADDGDESCFQHRRHGPSTCHCSAVEYTRENKVHAVNESKNKGGYRV